jgi:hypothetical protein
MTIISSILGLLSLHLLDSVVSALPNAVPGYPLIPYTSPNSSSSAPTSVSYESTLSYTTAAVLSYPSTSSAVTIPSYVTSPISYTLPSVSYSLPGTYYSSFYISSVVVSYPTPPVYPITPYASIPSVYSIPSPPVYSTPSYTTPSMSTPVYVSSPYTTYVTPSYSSPIESTSPTYPSQPTYVTSSIQSYPPASPSQPTTPSPPTCPVNILSPGTFELWTYAPGQCDLDNRPVFSTVLPHGILTQINSIINSQSPRSFSFSYTTLVAPYIVTMADHGDLWWQMYPHSID